MGTMLNIVIHSVSLEFPKLEMTIIFYREPIAISVALWVTEKQLKLNKNVAFTGAAIPNPFAAALWLHHQGEALALYSSCPGTDVSGLSTIRSNQ